MVAAGAAAWRVGRACAAAGGRSLERTRLGPGRRRGAGRGRRDDPAGRLPQGPGSQDPGCLRRGSLDGGRRRDDVLPLAAHEPARGFDRLAPRVLRCPECLRNRGLARRPLPDAAPRPDQSRGGIPDGGGGGPADHLLRAGHGCPAVFELHPNRRMGGRKPMHFGVVGLGTGTLAAFAEPGDRVRIYEINSQVEELARKEFGYLGNCKGSETVVLGDARITMERELAAGANQGFDALFIDAFSGDSIPIHLMTREAFELYFRHLQPNGVLAVHITNLHLDLSDPVRVLAREMGAGAVWVEHWTEDGYGSDWVLDQPEQGVSSRCGTAGRGERVGFGATPGDPLDRRLQQPAGRDRLGPGLGLVVALDTRRGAPRVDCGWGVVD